jgi:import inner membrane translocase subunit TIM10
MFSQQKPSLELQQAELNLELFTSTTTLMQKTCFDKCVSRDYKQDSLSKAEQVCVDRCLVKFMEANKIIQDLSVQTLSNS